MRHLAPGGALAFAVTAISFGGIADAAPWHAQTVQVERVKPTKDQRKTLRFLRSNVSFLRAQLDALRERQGIRTGRADAVDPRQLLVDQMMAEALAASGNADSSAAWLTARDYLEELQALMDFEAELDGVTALLDGQAERLARLQSEYLEQQGTAVMVLASGIGGGVPPAMVVGRDDERMRIDLLPADVAALADGGLVRVWYEFVEPREQVLEVAFEDAAGTRHEPVYLTVSPEPERLTFVELDLSEVSRDGDAAGLTAKSWTGATEWMGQPSTAGGPSR